MLFTWGSRRATCKLTSHSDRTTMSCDKDASMGGGCIFPCINFMLFCCTTILRIRYYPTNSWTSALARLIDKSEDWNFCANTLLVWPLTKQLFLLFVFHFYFIPCILIWSLPHSFIFTTKIYWKTESYKELQEVFALKRVPKWPYQENNGSVRPIPPSWNRKEVVWQQWTLSLFPLPLIDSIVSLHLRNIFLPAATGSRSISTLSSFPSPSFPPPPQFFKRTTYCWCLVKIANLRGAPIVTMHNQLLPVTKCEHLLLSSIWWFPPCLPKKVQNFQKNRTSTPWPWESRTYVACFLFWKFSQATSAPLDQNLFLCGGLENYKNKNHKT